MANRFTKAVSKIHSFPRITHSFLLTKLFCVTVKYANTSGVKLLSVSEHEAHLEMPNRKKVQNHIGGVHALAAALLAESATGIVCGMNVPDTHNPVLKSMTVHYQRRMQGKLSAIATLSPEQIQAIKTQDKGETIVGVTIHDESGQQPIECTMVWAWIPKKR